MKQLLVWAMAWACAALCAGRASADCIDQAAAHHAVNPHVLRAIGWHESRLRPEALARNANGTVDIGAFQINSMHLGTLSSHGVDAAALRDGCVSAYVAAWHYARQVHQFGNTWRAVGAYHSHTPARSAWYANAIAAVLIKWRVAPAGPLPYDPAATLSPLAGRGGPPLRGRGPAPQAPADAPIALYDQPDTLSAPRD